VPKSISQGVAVSLGPTEIVGSTGFSKGILARPCSASGPSMAARISLEIRTVIVWYLHRKDKLASRLLAEQLPSLSFQFTWKELVTTSFVVVTRNAQKAFGASFIYAPISLFTRLKDIDELNGRGDHVCIWCCVI
jgi:hypothetical protein